MTLFLYCPPPFCYFWFVFPQISNPVESVDEPALGQLVSCTHPGSKHRIFNTFHARTKNRSFLYLSKASDCLYFSPIVLLKNPSRQMNVDIKNIYFPSSSDFHGFHLRINSVWSWFGGAVPAQPAIVSTSNGSRKVAGCTSWQRQGATEDGLNLMRSH